MRGHAGPSETVLEQYAVVGDAILDGASEAGFTVNGRLQIVGWNEPAHRLLGYEQAEVCGRHCADIIQAVHENGEPLCTRDCEGVRCFQEYRPFACKSCFARHKSGTMVRVGFESIVLPHESDVITDDILIAAVYLHSDLDARDAPQPVLRIYTLGGFSLVAGARPLALGNWKRKKSSTLLKILVARIGQGVEREALVDALWPSAGEERGSAQLRVHIHEIRQRLREAGCPELLVTDDGSYRISAQAVWLDSVQYEEEIAIADDHVREGRLEEALEAYRGAERLYRGEYLAGLDDDWCSFERARYESMYFEMCRGMASCLARLGATEEAVVICQHVLSRDPYREGLLQDLMRYLADLGRIDSVRDHFRYFSTLVIEDGGRLMPETERIYSGIVDG